MFKNIQVLFCETNYVTLVTSFLHHILRYHIISYHIISYDHIISYHIILYSNIITNQKQTYTKTQHDVEDMIKKPEAIDHALNTSFNYKWTKQNNTLSKETRTRKTHMTYPKNYIICTQIIKLVSINFWNGGFPLFYIFVQRNLKRNVHRF